MLRLPLVVEPPREVILQDGSRGLRTGGCNLCGECCRGDNSDDPVFAGQKPKVEGFCVLFEWAEPGIGVCTGHGTHPYYLLGCGSAPSKPNNYAHVLGCSYAFERVS